MNRRKCDCRMVVQESFLFYFRFSPREVPLEESLGISFVVLVGLPCFFLFGVSCLTLFDSWQRQSCSRICSGIRFEVKGAVLPVVGPLEALPRVPPVAPLVGPRNKLLMLLRGSGQLNPLMLPPKRSKISSGPMLAPVPLHSSLDWLARFFILSA